MPVYRNRRGVSLLATILTALVAITAQPAGQQAQTSAQSPPPQTPPVPPPPLPAADNGISVGRPKIFDNRALTIMIDEWQRALRNIQLVDQAKLSAAFGLLQGSSMREVSSALSATTLPTPQTLNRTITNTGIVDDEGNPLPDTSQRTSETTRAAFTPQPPALDPLPSFAGMPTNFGQHPSDLLSDQVNLTYQIFNLRMLLERSLSDRLLSESSGQTRRQAVVGFNITVDPPRTAEDAVAVVEVTLSAATSQADGLSLVSLMPQEKTYNATALSTKQNAFGGAAVAGMFSIGYTQRRRGQDFYLYRDADTIAYERMTDHAEATQASSSNTIVFGWMFRPVLGRKAVSPGLRQMFAVISLPHDDMPGAKADGRLTATVKTYWKKYDRNTMTSYELKDANRAARLRYLASGTLAKPEIFDARYVRTRVYDGIVVKATNQYEDHLRPQVDGIRWTIVGPKTVVLSAAGNNFFAGTQVTVAGKTYVGNSDGLILKSSQAFDLTTGLEVLESGAGSIIGRYGAAVDLRVRCPDEATVPAIGTVALWPERGGMRRIAVDINGIPSQCPATPVLSVNGTVLPPPYQTVTTAGVTQFSTYFDNALLDGKGGKLKVTWPFMPPTWTLYDVLASADADYQYSKLGAKALLLTTTNNFGFEVNPEQPNEQSVCWTILSEAGEIVLKTPKCAGGSSRTTSLSDTAIKVTLDGDVPERLVLISPWKSTTFLELAKAGKEPAKEPKPLAVAQFDAVWLPVPVKDARKIARVEANGKEVRKTFKDGGDPETPITTMSVELTRELTKDAGALDLTFGTPRDR